MKRQVYIKKFVLIVFIMKKPVLYVFAILLAISSCSQKNEEIFGEYFEEWNITIPYKDVSQSETYHLLEAVIDYVDKNQAILIAFPSSNMNHQSVTHFNEYFNNSEEAIALFKRKDCGFVLISTYLDFLMSKKYQTIDSEWWGNKFFTFLELVLSSEMCMSAINVAEKVHLMVLSFESLKYEPYRLRHFNIMISIMLSSNYPPFVKDLKPLLRETTMGAYYHLVTSPDCLKPGLFTSGCPMDLDQTAVLLTGYARQFIKNNK